MSGKMLCTECCQVYMGKEIVMAKWEAKWNYSNIQYSKWISQSFLKSITGLDSDIVFIG